MYTPATEPMRHQIEAIVAASRQPPGPDNTFAYLMEMGTGKSKVVLDEWGQMATSGGPRNLLVVGPKGSYKNWYEDKSDIQRAEINVHLDPEFRRKMRVLGWRSGGGTNFRNDAREFLRYRGPKGLFVNVEALSTDTGAADLIREYMEDTREFGYMAVDESTKIKGKSKRTERITELGEEAAVRRILTGLVTPRSPLDLFYQMNFLSSRILGYSSIWAFKSRYALMKKMMVGGRSFKVIVGFQNLDELTEKVGRWSYRALKKDCLDLEPKVYTTREVEHTPEQARVYKALKQSATAMLDSGAYVTTQHAMTLMMRLHQINVGHVVDEEGQEHDIPDNRIEALMEVLDEHQGKAVIWTPYRAPLRKIVARLTEEYGSATVAEFHGGNAGTRGEDERRFLGDPACRFMVATQGAGMMGNNWVCADLVCYFANDHDLEHRDQSEDRCHRKGQVNRVTYVDFIVPGTVDSKIVRALRKKIDMATAIAGDNYREWIV